MAKNVKRIAKVLGAEVVGQLPEVGGGAFGAARLIRSIETLKTRLVPGTGRRPGRPSDPAWVRHPKVPISEATKRRLTRLAEQASLAGRKVTPMQIAAQILEDALSSVPDR